MKKRMVSVVLASMLLVSSLTGCVGTSAGTSSTSEAVSTTQEDSAATTVTETTAVETASVGEPVEIEFWHALGGTLGDSLQSIIESYNASQSQYIIKPVIIGSYTEIDEKLQAAYVAKNVPALVAGGSQDTFYQKGACKL